MAILSPEQYLVDYQLLNAGDAVVRPGIYIPLAILTNVSPDEAHQTNGDIRKVLFEINKLVFARLNQLDAASKPTRFSMTRTVPTGVNSTTIRQAYTSTFDLDVSFSDVSNE